MPKEIERAIFEEPVLFSPVTIAGQFVVRSFYHAISGFGTAQTERYDRITSHALQLTDSWVKVTWHDFGRLEGTDAYWSVGDGTTDELKKLNDELCNEHVAEEQIKELMNDILNDPFDDYTGIRVNGREVSVTDLLDFRLGLG